MRRYVQRLTAATIIAFLASVVSPQVGLYSHDHPGGEHAHVHSDEGAVGRREHAGDSSDDHRHAPVNRPIHAPTARAAGEAAPRIERTQAAQDSGHWHVKNPYGRMLPLGIPPLGTTAVIEALWPPGAATLLDRPLPSRRARGPPPLLPR